MVDNKNSKKRESLIRTKKPKETVISDDSEMAF